MNEKRDGGKKITLARITKNIRHGYVLLMNNIFQRFTAGTQKVLFIILFAAAGIYCTMLLFGSGTGGLPNTGQITRPVMQGKPPGHETARIRIRLNGLKSYLDSLSTTKQGIRKRDSIIFHNPGLLDSIKIWEQRVERMENN